MTIPAKFGGEGRDFVKVCVCCERPPDNTKGCLIQNVAHVGGFEMAKTVPLWGGLDETSVKSGFFRYLRRRRHATAQVS